MILFKKKNKWFLFFKTDIVSPNPIYPITFPLVILIVQLMYFFYS